MLIDLNFYFINNVQYYIILNNIFLSNSKVF